MHENNVRLSYICSFSIIFPQMRLKPPTCVPRIFTTPVESVWKLVSIAIVLRLIKRSCKKQRRFSKPQTRTHSDRNPPSAHSQWYMIYETPHLSATELILDSWWMNCIISSDKSLSHSCIALIHQCTLRWRKILLSKPIGPRQTQ